MSDLTAAVARAVNRHPLLVVLVLVLVTAGAGVAATQQEQVQEGVEVAEGRAAEAGAVIEERFEASGAPFQVLVRSPGRDVRNVDALRVSAAIGATFNEGPLAELLEAPGGAPPVLGFLAPALQAAREAGLELGELDDADVRDLQEQALERVPPPVAEQAEELLGTGERPEAGLIIVFLDVTELDDDARLEVESLAAEQLDELALPEGLTLEPFTVQLLLDQGEIGPEIGRLFGTALALILVLLGVVFWVRPAEGEGGRIARRTLADVALVLVVILAAVVWMQGAGVLLGPDYAGLIGYFSPQTQVVPVIIVGLGVDYAIHLQTRYREGLVTGESPDRSLELTARTVGVALLLATVTTAVGFLTNLTSPFDALATLGVLAAVGIAAALVLTLTAIPAARVLLDRRAVRRETLPSESFSNRSEGRLHRIAEATAVLAERGPRAVLAIALVLGIAGGWGFTQLDRAFSFTDFVPQDAPMLGTLETIEEEIGGGFGDRTDVLIEGDIATVAGHDALIDSLEAAGQLDGVQQLAGRPDAESPISVVRSAVEAEPDLAAVIEALDAAEDLRLGGTGATDDDVAELYEQVAQAVPDQAEEVLAEVDGALWARVSIRTDVPEAGVGRLADALEQAFGPVADAGPRVTATSQDIVSAMLTDQIERAQLLSIGLALGVVLVLLTVYYTAAHRRPLLGVVTIAPVVLVLAWTFGTMALTGIPLTPVTATLAALSIGVGIDFSIHVVNRFQQEAESKPDADDSHLLRTTTGETGSALVGSALTTVLGFGVLITSTLVPFRQLGLVTVLAIGFSLLAALLVLPSLLRVTDRRPDAERQR